MKETTKKGMACPICGSPVDPIFKPFCSRRCADIDLHRWLSDSYAIPAADDESESDHPNGVDGGE